MRLRQILQSDRHGAGHLPHGLALAIANGMGCPVCSNHKVLAGYNDLETLYPLLAKEWHPTKNGDLKPSMVVPGSGKKVWWQCVDGHEWQAVIRKRAILGQGCPICYKLSCKKKR